MRYWLALAFTGNHPHNSAKAILRVRGGFGGSFDAFHKFAYVFVHFFLQLLQFKAHADNLGASVPREHRGSTRRPRVIFEYLYDVFDGVYLASVKLPDTNMGIVGVGKFLCIFHHTVNINGYATTSSINGSVIAA
jgi:hypothetical protein